MDALKGNIYEILNGSKQFKIPIYQRFYSWDIEQCRKLWNDIVNMKKKNKEGHFIGSIVNIAEKAMPTGVQKFTIIDGQQRVTTLTLLLTALRDYMINNPENKTVNYRKIENILLKNEYEDGEEQYKLILTETDRNNLMDLIDRKPIDENIVSRIISNYEFFYDRITALEIEPKDVYESIGKLQIVNITLEREKDDAQEIFESLNSTGKELSESDLIRNYILMGLEPNEQNYVYGYLWRPMELLFGYEKQDETMDKFFRDYITMQLTRIPKKNRVYEEFKAYHINSEFETIRELCEDLLAHAKYYTNIIFERSNNPKIKALYSDINELRMEVAYPFLLKVHNDFENGIISEDDLIEILEICTSYVFRRSISNIPTNSHNKTFATLSNRVKQDDYLNSIKAFFVLCDDYKVFPDDNKFTDDFVNRDIYNMKTCSFVLAHLENYNNKLPVIMDNYTIEHIMPQNPKMRDEWKEMLGENWKDIQKRYLHTIGNLTLTGYNSEMSDNSFTEKLDMTGGFKESALKLNSYVVKASEWNEDSIKERAMLLADIAKRVWKYQMKNFLSIKRKMMKLINIQ